MKPLNFLVTGGAGFIGSTFIDRALSLGHSACAFDNLSTGRMHFLKNASTQANFEFIKGDIRNKSEVEAAFSKTRPDWVIHFAANADVRHGLERTQKDLEHNTIGTWNVLETARTNGCKKILFSSTGSVYGEPTVFPTPEDCPFPIQTSLYAASKMAGENLISAYCHGFGMTGVVFRFVSILGPRYTHGHVFDFVKMLRENSDSLKILGNGRQNKSYLHVQDLMDGLFIAILNSKPGYEVFNIGHDDSLIVDESAKTICTVMGVQPTFHHTGGERGWVGDSPRIQLDTTKLKKLGWKTKNDLHQSVRETVKYLQDNSFLLSEEPVK